ALQRAAIPFKLMANFVELAHTRHFAATTELQMISSHEIILAVIFPPRNIKVHSSDTIMVVWRHFLKLRKIPDAVATHRVHQITTHHARGVRQPLGDLS